MLQQEIKEYKKENEHNTSNKEILGYLYDNGVIDKPQNPGPRFSDWVNFIIK